MEQTSCIFWFSGTGNSLYAARKLSASLGDLPLTRITDKAHSSAVGGDGAQIGFVYPSYYGNLPRAVSKFVEKLVILPGTYIFAIVTMGGFGLGSVGSMEKVLKAKGLRLSYGRGVSMPANYVLNYNPADPGQSEAKLDKTNKRIQKIAAEIAAGAQSVRTFPLTADNLYRDVVNLDAGYTVNAECTNCGICAKICPVGNIRLERGKPTWLHHCEHCVACISWCPAKAIDYGDKTQERRRYRNPRTTAKEIAEDKVEDAVKEAVEEIAKVES